MGNFPLSPTDTDCHTSGAKLSHQHLHCCLLGCEWWGHHRLLPGLLYGGAASQQRCRGCVRSALSALAWGKQVGGWAAGECPGHGKSNGCEDVMYITKDRQWWGRSWGRCCFFSSPLSPQRQDNIMLCRVKGSCFHLLKCLFMKRPDHQRGCVYAAPLLLMWTTDRAPKGKAPIMFLGTCMCFRNMSWKSIRKYFHM